MKKAIVWFRNDLRLHDNEALVDALKHADEIIPVYVLDDRIFRTKTKFGFEKTGVHRLRFILDSLADLRQSLEALGTTLIVRQGITEDVLTEIANTHKTSWVYCNRERTQEEVHIQDQLEESLWSIGQEIRYYRGKMLYYTSDLPFPVTQTPDVFTTFRKEVEKFVPVREPISSPQEEITPISADIDQGEIPSIQDYGFDTSQSETPAYMIGGETTALAHLKYYIWESNNIATYKETRNELLGKDFSSKFSPWLAAGCLSPKMIYSEISKYEKQVKKNNSTYWMKFELLWRDFFRLQGKKYGNKIFQYQGTHGDDSFPRADQDMKRFRVWAEARTGTPFIDANMLELNTTGFMSNRGRQNVASYLIKDLKLDWRIGAEYFESMLIDYDPCSNYGNWSYLAGVGVDPRQDRYFNILSQARRYDGCGKYVKHWIPALAALPDAYIHNPDQLDEDKAASYDLEIGKDYPVALVKSSKWD